MTRCAFKWLDDTEVRHCERHLGHGVTPGIQHGVYVDHLDARGNTYPRHGNPGDPSPRSPYHAPLMVIEYDVELEVRAAIANLIRIPDGKHGARLMRLTGLELDAIHTLIDTLRKALP